MGLKPSSGQCVETEQATFEGFLDRAREQAARQGTRQGALMRETVRAVNAVKSFGLRLGQYAFCPGRKGEARQTRMSVVGEFSMEQDALAPVARISFVGGRHEIRLRDDGRNCVISCALAEPLPARVFRKHARAFNVSAAPTPEQRAGLPPGTGGVAFCDSDRRRFTLVTPPLASGIPDALMRSICAELNAGDLKAYEESKKNSRANNNRIPPKNRVKHGEV